MKISTNNGFASLIGKPRREGFSVSSFLFVTLIGLIFTISGLVFVKDELLSLGWPTTTGKVTSVATSTDSDGNPMYRPTAEYTVDGQTYTATPGTTSSVARAIGENMTVAYEPSNPSRGVLRSSGLDFLVYLFPLIGLLIITISIVAFVRSLKRGQTINDLQQRGVKLQGVVTDVQSMNNSSGQSGTRVVVSATGTDGQVKNYVSDEVVGNTFSLLEFRNQPIPIDVYVDPNNPDDYYVDISDIPSLTPEKIASLLRRAAGPQSILPPAPGTPPPASTPPTSTPIEKDRLA